MSKEHRYLKESSRKTCIQEYGIGNPGMLFSHCKINLLNENVAEN